MVINIKNTKRDFLRFIDLKNVNEVLDIGCSKGYLSKYFCKNNIYSTGVDIKNFDINLDKFNFINEDIREFDFNKKYDVIISSLVLHFLKKEEGFDLIEKMKKNTSEGGYNLLILPSNQDLLFRENYCCPQIEDLKTLYSNWKIIKCLSDFTESEEHSSKGLHNHHLIFFLVKNEKH